MRLSRLNSSRSTGAKASSNRLFIGLPDRSPISELFHGTMYMTFGCSRSPVTVAVFSSSRSTPPGGFWPAALGARATGWVPADGEAVLDGLEAPPGAGGAVLARGSPASICAVDFDGGAACDAPEEGVVGGAS